MTSPFATPAMRALRRRLHDTRRTPDLRSLYVWNGNEQPILQQLIDALEPGGAAALVDLEPMPTRRRRS
jgi:hypothetical protein